MNLKHQIKLAIAASLVAAAPLIHAQGLTTAAAPSAPAAPVAPPSPAKQALINELLTIQKPGIEAMARSIVQQPLSRLLPEIKQALLKVPADKRATVAQSIQTSLQQFAQTNGDALAAQADKLQPTVVAPLLNERFNEDELRQVVAFLKSPVSKKFAEVGGEMQNAMGQKLMADNAPTLESHFKVLQIDIAKQLGITPAAAPAASAPAKAPAKK